MQTIGNYLKSGREARNIRLSEVARSTKISKWYLDCLEKDEFDKIPGGPYIKGYITSYASYIGIEEDEILKRYDSLQINSDDENETQDHLPQDKKRQKSIGFSFGKKYLLFLSMAVLILLTFGFIYYLFQNKTHIVAQLQDTQGLKSQSSPSSKVKPGEFGRVSNDSSAPSDKSENFQTVKDKKSPQKQEVANGSRLTDLSKSNHLKPIEAKNNSDQNYQDATGKGSLAILSAEEDVAFPPKTVKEESAIPGTSPFPEAGNTQSAPQNAPMIESKTPALQGAPQPFDGYSGSAQGTGSQEAKLLVADNMRVVRAVATSEIKNKNPLDLGNSFPWTTEKVYIWSMIECKQPPSSVRHTYYFEGQKVNDIELKIKSPQWRTWSYKTLLEKRWIGQWKVEITSAEGELLQSIFFEVN